MKLVVDGNDGTGKSTLVARLRDLGYDVADRGVPTKMTDDPSVCAVEGEVYLILDAPVEVCQARLAKAGKNLEERYHTVADLRHCAVQGSRGGVEGGGRRFRRNAGRSPGALPARARAVFVVLSPDPPP